MEICLTGRRVGAAESVQIGLALRPVPAADLNTAVDELATALVSAPLKAAAETRGARSDRGVLASSSAADSA